MSDLLTFARHCFNIVNSEGADEVEAIRDEIHARGITNDLHVGHDPNDTEFWTQERTVEWLLGQMAKIIDEKQWFAMNSCLNMLDSKLEGIT